MFLVERKEKLIDSDAQNTSQNNNEGETKYDYYITNEGDEKCTHKIQVFKASKSSNEEPNGQGNSIKTIPNKLETVF